MLIAAHRSRCRRSITAQIASRATPAAALRKTIYAVRCQHVHLSADQTADGLQTGLKRKWLLFGCQHTQLVEPMHFEPDLADRQGHRTVPAYDPAADARNQKDCPIDEPQLIQRIYLSVLRWEESGDVIHIGACSGGNSSLDRCNERLPPSSWPHWLRTHICSARYSCICTFSSFTAMFFCSPPVVRLLAARTDV